MLVIDEATYFSNRLRGNLSPTAQEDYAKALFEFAKEFNIAIVMTWHCLSEIPPYFLNPCETLYVLHKGEATSIPIIRTVLAPHIVSIPKSTLPYDWCSPASFDPVLFPESKIKYTFVSAWRVIKTRKIDVQRNPEAVGTTIRMA